MIYTKRERSTLLYLFGYIAWLMKVLVRSSNLVGALSWAPLAENFFTVAAIILMIAALIFDRLSIRELITITVLMLLAVFSYSQNHYFYVLSSMICLIASKNVDIRRVIDVSWRIKAVWITFHVAAYILVWIFNPSSIQFVYRGEQLRHYFFLSHANTAAMLLAWTMIEYVYAHFEKVRTRTYVFLWLIFVIFNIFTVSRTSVIMLTLTFLFCILYKKNHLSTRFIRWFAKYGFAICSVLFPLLSFLYSKTSGWLSQMINMVNALLTGRLVYGAFGISQYGLTLFGQKITFSQVIQWNGIWIDQVLFDNTYLYYAIALGVIWLVLISVGFALAEKKLTVFECILITAYILFSISENYTVNVVECFPLLFLRKVIFNEPAVMTPAVLSVSAYSRQKEE